MVINLESFENSTYRKHAIERICNFAKKKFSTRCFRNLKWRRLRNRVYLELLERSRCRCSYYHIAARKISPFGANCLRYKLPLHPNGHLLIIMMTKMSVFYICVLISADAPYLCSRAFESSVTHTSFCTRNSVPSFPALMQFFPTVSTLINEGSFILKRYRVKVKQDLE